MRPPGTKEELELRRRKAVALLQQGLSTREVARQIGCAPASVSRWRQAFARHGPAGLAAQPQAGRPARLQPRDLERLRQILLAGPAAWGFRTDLWTLARLKQVIASQFGVEYHVSHVHRLLQQLGFSCQKPERVAREQDPAAVQHFREVEWSAIKKKPGASGGASSSVTRAGSCCNR